MLNPFKGLKKVFSPKTAFAPFKAAHKAVTKPKSVFGKLKPRSPHAAAKSFFGVGKNKKTAAPTVGSMFGRKDTANRPPAPEPSNRDFGRRMGRMSRMGGRQMEQ